MFERAHKQASARQTERHRPLTAVDRQFAPIRMPNAMTRTAAVTDLVPPGDTGLQAVLDQLERVLLGKSEQVALSLACLLARGHLLIEDIPGVGKTTLAQAMGASLGLPWSRIQFTSDLLPADIVGVSIFDTVNSRFEFRHGPVFTSVLLADEINRAPPKAQSALLEAMEERQVSVDGTSYPLSDDFFVIATQNPADQLGAYPLPESQLDRFLVGIEIGYPDPASERALLEHGDRRAHIAELEPCANPQMLAHWMAKADAVHVAAPVLDYVQALLLATREGDVGLSPRAGLALLRLSRAFALLNGRGHVLPDDVHDIFPALAGHRLTGRVSTGRHAAEAILDRVVMP